MFRLLASEGVHIDVGEFPTLSDKGLADHALDYLTETKRPEHYKTITHSLKETGVIIPGKNQAANLLAQINRDDRFERVGRGIYTIKHPPTPPM